MSATPGPSAGGGGGGGGGLSGGGGWWCFFFFFFFGFGASAGFVGVTPPVGSPEAPPPLAVEPSTNAAPPVSVAWAPPGQASSATTNASSARRRTAEGMRAHRPAAGPCLG